MLASLFALARPDATTRMLLIDATPRVVVTAFVAIVFAYPLPVAVKSRMDAFMSAHGRISSVARAACDVAISVFGLAALVAVAGETCHAFLYAKF